MNAQIKLQSFLQGKFFEAQTKNPSYSLRAFAKKIGIVPGAASELLRGHRQASRKMVARIAKKLMLDPQETHELLKHFPETRKERKTQKLEQDIVSKDYLKLTADQFHLISEWVHYAILSLIMTNNFRSNPEWMAKRLGVTPTKVTACLERLERLGLIEKNAKGVFTRTIARIHTPDDVFNVSIQKAHIADMELAKQALQDIPLELRDFTSVSVPTAPELLPDAKKLIRKFREELAHLLSSKPSSEVYQMSVYLYPLTKPLKGESK
jgi:uncharacterized protein (TIGR02147 family)